MKNTELLKPKTIFRILILIAFIYLIYVALWHFFHFQYLHFEDGISLKIPSYTQEFRNNKLEGHSDYFEIQSIQSRGQAHVPRQLPTVEEISKKIFNVSDPIDGENRNRKKRKSMTVAMATMYARPKRYHHQLYDDFAPYALSNLLSYGHRHGYPLFFLHSDQILKSESASSVYWSKLSILKYYLKTNLYDWILWTDIDVYILRQDIPLNYFLEQVPKEQHIVGVLECGRLSMTYLKRAIRSGFLFLRNSPETLEFLEAWEKLQSKYKNSLTPEQDALEELYSSTASKMASWFFMFPTKVLHAYAECVELNQTFSVHFPNSERKMCMRQWQQSLFPELRPINIY